MQKLLVKKFGYGENEEAQYSWYSKFKHYWTHYDTDNIFDESKEMYCSGVSLLLHSVKNSCPDIANLVEELLWKRVLYGI